MLRPPLRAISLVILLVALLSAAGLFPASAAGVRGPSSSADPYVVGLASGVEVTSLLTTGDSVNAGPGGAPYRLVGIPDGLGAFDNGDGTFTLLVAHELDGSVGVTRAHGARGAFVSRWVVRKGDLAVLGGSDLIQRVATWDRAARAYNAPATGVVLRRFCSADLAPAAAYYHAASGLGYSGRIFMNGEEAGAEGRAFAHLMDGTSYELPRLGRFNRENSLANPGTGLTTMVVGTDDSDGGQIYVYVGAKTGAGSPIERAGLTNGRLYGLRLAGVANETAATTLPAGATFTLVDLGDVSGMSGLDLEGASNTAGATRFMRPEDGAWDPANPRVFYFNTTASNTTPSRLWRLTFNDAANPAAGGTVAMLLDGSEGQRMLDNMAVNARGQLLLQENPGASSRLSKIWRYDVAADKLEAIAEHDPALFTRGAPGFLTDDEEASGIIDAGAILGEGAYLFTVQVHRTSGDAELVQGGQLALLRLPVPPATPSPTAKPGPSPTARPGPTPTTTPIPLVRRALLPVVTRP